ncbi:6,7-dimethyl-8-ribityllumazine synthase [Buchnera aphidicola]|uniref:6,7-dimethyl-8-ribityllumazine synthase n=1 Tax=Buchnera aphidicola TaxID=9 RepID=UPI003463E4C8
MNIKEYHYKIKKFNTINSQYESQNSNIAIIVPRFNSFINQNLLFGALDTLERIGKIKKKNIKIIKVPGAYEIPIIANILSQTKNYQGIIALGTIIKGETMHFEKISNAIIQKLLEISIKTSTPIGLGILILKNIDQAINRSGLKFGNKGSEAAMTILEMINIIQDIQK